MVQRAQRDPESFPLGADESASGIDRKPARSIPQRR